MTTFDRIEQRMPELMGELAPARVPDYFDDMLRQSAGTRQRPGWSSLERWLPMGVIARIEPVREFSWRPIVLAAILIVALSASIALYAASQRSVPLPPPFGPATNGDVLVAPNGDILAFDVTTQATRPVIADNGVDIAPVFAPNGREFLFERTTGTDAGMWVANADGTNARRVFDPTGYEVTWSDWSQSGDRLVMVGQTNDSKTVIALVDPDGGAPTLLRPDGRFTAAVLPYGRDFLVLAAGLPGASGPESHEFWRLDLDDPASLRLLPASPSALNRLALSPDGSELVYATWEDGQGIGMNLHVLNLDDNQDRLITALDNETYGWQAPEFLPDGKTIIADRWAVESKYQLALVPADGSPGRAIGPVRSSDSGSTKWFVSPDGRTVLATYYDNGTSDRKVWQIDVASGVGTELSMSEPDFLTWQRAGQ